MGAPDAGLELSRGGSKSCSAALLPVQQKQCVSSYRNQEGVSSQTVAEGVIIKAHLARGIICPVVPPGGAEESMSSTGDVHTGLLEANSMAY